MNCVIRTRWTPAMTEALRSQYAAARAVRRLRNLADRLGVDLGQLYRKAHQLGIAEPRRP
jgi:hypothetical protein